MQTRSNFSGKLGFVLAAAGSAVGLGNIWRFPYLAAKYGGGTFLLVYLILVVTFGFSLMVAEVALGRKTGLSAIGAFKKLDKRFGFVGVLASIVPMIIFPYYCVIGGWVVKYFISFVSGQHASAAQDGFFEGFISKPVEPIVWLVLFVLFTAVIVILGVEKGIEKASKIMMPILVVLSVGIAIFCITRPGAGAGVAYYLKPSVKGLNPKTILAAMGQMFYSMSLAMGIMVTYGSYMKKENSLESSVRQIEIFDTLIAFLAGLMIVPAVFVFSGGDEQALGKGAGLMFITLPKVFESMSMGRIVGIVFFLLVFFAALTSAISLMETIVSILQDKLKWSRVTASIVVFFFAIALGITSSLGYGVWGSFQIIGLSILDFYDFVSNSVLMPIVAFLTCIFVGYIIKPKAIEEEVLESGRFKSKRLFEVVIRYVAPVFIILILISSVLDTLGIFKL